MYTRQETMQFIEQFCEAKELFLNGMCYWFAVILNRRFRNSLICYDPIINHFVCKVGSAYYDASGVARDANYIEWSEYVWSDSIHAERIIRDCMIKTGGTFNAKDYEDSSWK